MRRRGLTLLELMVALAVVLALAALAMPAVGGRLGAVRADTLAREVRASVAEVRGDAIRDGVSWRVELVEGGAGSGGRESAGSSAGGGWRLVARVYEPESGVQAEAPARFVGPVFDDERSGSDASGVRHEVAARTLLVLPRGARASRQEPRGAEAGRGSSAGGAEDAGWIGGRVARAADEGLTLGLLLATGSALAGAPVYVTLEDGSVLVVSLDAWTGAAVVESWKAPAEDEGWGGEAAASGRGGVAAERGGGAGGRP